MKKFFAGLLFTAVLPLIASPTQNRFNDGICPPFPSVAYAGHTVGGNWCACGTSGCACDPGEDPTGQSIKPVGDRTAPAKHRGGAPTNTNRVPGFDFASTAMMAALAIFLWTRLRA